MNKLLELHQRYEVYGDVTCSCCGNSERECVKVFAQSRKEAEKLGLEELASLSDSGDPEVSISYVEEEPPKLWRLTIKFKKGKPFSTPILGYWDHLNENKEEIGAYLARVLFPKKEFKSVDLGNDAGR